MVYMGTYRAVKLYSLSRLTGVLLDVLDDPEAMCNLFTVEEVVQAKTIKNGLKLLSKKEVRSCFDGAPLSDQKYGNMGINPPEMLHVAGVGLFKYMFTCLSDSIGLNGTKEREKEQLDGLYQVLTSQSTRQKARRIYQGLQCIMA